MLWKHVRQDAIIGILLKAIKNSKTRYKLSDNCSVMLEVSRPFPEHTESRGVSNENMFWKDLDCL